MMKKIKLIFVIMFPLVAIIMLLFSSICKKIKFRKIVNEDNDFYINIK